MSTKTCSGPCGQSLPETEFHWRNKAAGTRINQCRTCTSLKSKAHYRKNRSMYMQKARRWNSKCRTEVFSKLLAYLKTHPCVDCDESDPVVLTFDHVRGRKMHGISQMLTGHRTWASIIKEIAKCDVRCANCHMRRTAIQLKWRKGLAG